MVWLFFFATTVGFGQIIFAYNLFKTIARKLATEEESKRIADEKARRKTPAGTSQIRRIDDTSFVSGQTIVVDGGETIR